MSQWTDLRNLTRQFHKIQDETIQARTEAKKRIPIVFFDEFDAPYKEQPLGWLKYFLMPLQDGIYMDDNDVFHFGKSIFVFAGSIAESHEKFVEKCQELTRNSGKSNHLSGAKVSDFLSRLRGYINVRDISYKKHEDRNEKSLFNNRAAKIRRAVILRDMLRKYLPQIVAPESVMVDVHGAIVAAFSNVPEFKHGVRSMEAIIQMARVPQKARSFQPSALPSEQQLELHVDGRKFMNEIREYLKEDHKNQ
jgi:hypothetical protein